MFVNSPYGYNWQTLRADVYTGYSMWLRTYSNMRGCVSNIKIIALKLNDSSRIRHEMTKSLEFPRNVKSKDLPHFGQQNQNYQSNWRTKLRNIFKIILVFPKLKKNNNGRWQPSRKRQIFRRRFEPGFGKNFQPSKNIQTRLHETLFQCSCQVK